MHPPEPLYAHLRTVKSYNTHVLTCLQFSPDGTHFFTGGLDGKGQVWSWDEGACIVEFECDSPMLSMAWHPTHPWILLYGYGNGLVVWMKYLVQSNKVRPFRRTCIGGPVDCLVFHPLGRYMAVGTEQCVKLIESTKEEDPSTLDYLHKDAKIRSLKFSEDGTSLIGVFSGNEVMSWNIEGMRFRWSHPTGPAILGADVAEDGASFVVHHPGCRMAVYRPSEEKPTASWTFRSDGDPGSRSQVLFAHKGQAVLCPDTEGPARIYDSQSGRLMQTLAGTGEPGHAIAVCSSQPAPWRPGTKTRFSLFIQAFCDPKLNVWRILTSPDKKYMTEVFLWQAGSPSVRAPKSSQMRQTPVCPSLQAMVRDKALYYTLPLHLYMCKLGQRVRGVAEHAQALVVHAWRAAWDRFVRFLFHVFDMERYELFKLLGTSRKFAPSNLDGS
ncbi:hypothetical protein BOTBODRAFT_49806 [Botryobasidium botryosum FD-172 SS1]|uniref:Uncharacterized protein n=1 Tax=Botryobasidium botryosum (strain FD-172 SS1) TaxID=930990 RepID=A0A067M0Y9_BOTB1|nr:hypothetical protein BOTBODRAFT_49806 [Botryobasidium botryosum FD-172 SS1]